MTVSDTTARTTAVTGTGAAQTIPFTFPITADSDISVVTTLIASPYTQATLTETTHYTVSNLGEAGGSITTVTPFVASTKTVQIIRSSPKTQTVDLTAGGSFDAETIEDAFDKLTRLLIELEDRIDVYLAGEADIVAGVDYQAYSSVLTSVASGGATALTALGVSTFAQTVTDDTTALAARTTLGTLAVGDFLCHENAVLCHENEPLTWAA